jgi:hypothetical protein
MNSYIEAMEKKERFTPSPSKEVRFVDDKGNVVQTRNMNRSERRRLKIYNRKAVK